MIINIANTLIANREAIESSHMPYVTFMSLVRKEFSHQALLEHNGNAFQASEALNMNRRTFMTNLGMSASQWKMENMPRDMA
ncbi:hypothetical protein MMG00_02515 [Ignatzschineria rhizosphaerae]|uniref:DNA binding HTH domain-containing protein n=1 Tax=Ignatzschineria rhizosphaerae TaxID=2923279 RepID=A0ABY3X1J2_9GAMM|nr:hypothetical protein [Ignatzschineria rhizosphaerae]UNM96748.1 hypothetical protein MMG00_02515 [Ignatzschineria rhizosphaerae]